MRKRFFYPAESLHHCRIPLTLLALVLAAFTAFFISMAADGVGPGESISFLLLVGADGAAILFWASVYGNCPTGGSCWRQTAFGFVAGGGAFADMVR